MAVLPWLGAATPTADAPAPTGMAAMIALSQGKAAGFHAFPEGFIPPNFLPGYVPESRSNVILWLGIVLCAFSVVVVVGRLISRRKTMGWVGIDDWLIVPAMIFCILYVIDLCVAATHGGLGKHSWDMKYEEVVIGVKTLFPSMILYTISIFFTKLSVLFFIYRLAGPICSNAMRYVLHAYFVFHICFGITTLFIFVFQCLPVKAGFDLDTRFDKDTHCKEYIEVFYATSVIHAISDIVLIVLPVKMVWGLQMPKQKKTAVILVFCLGSLACICSILRMVYIWDFAKSYDLGWDAFYPSLFGVLETTIAINTSSMPALKPLFARYVPGLVSSIVRSSNRKSMEVPRSTGYSTEAKSRRESFMSWFQLPARQQTTTTNSTSVHMTDLPRIEEPTAAVTRQRSHSEPQPYHQRSHETLAVSDNGDADSQKGIMKTMSVRVSYEPRPTEQRHSHESRPVPYRPGHHM
ncbi:hypothetical protein EDC01DRAFT_124356 [Geopyxis carbonaria]|nr:hypothetical protein EDC01DRAFT_124356 [Geopyxis carbonaria]